MRVRMPSVTLWSHVKCRQVLIVTHGWRSVMASIRMRNGKYQVQVRVRGVSRAKSFMTHAAARKWARQQEVDAETRTYLRQRYQPASFAEVLDRYLREVTPTKRNTSYEPPVIRALLRQGWVNKSLSALSASDVAAYRDARLRTIKGSSLHREFCVLKHACNLADREWDWDVPQDIFTRVRVVRQPAAMIRRITPEMVGQLLDATKLSRNKLLKPLIILALETGLRRGELLSLRWSDVNWQDGVLRVTETKSGYPRNIPLTPLALAALAALKDRKDPAVEQVFPISPNAVKLGFARVRERAGLCHVRFHDLRHEAVSRFFEMGLTPPEVASISGHRTLSQLMRYSHADAARVMRKVREGAQTSQITGEAEKGPIRLET